MSSTARQAVARIVRFQAAARQGATAALAAEMARLARATQGRMTKDTGDLAASVAATGPTTTGQTITVGVVVGSDHAAAQEFGTATNRAHPTFRPSIVESQARTPGAIAAAIRHTFE